MNYKILQGDVLDQLKTLSAESVQCCVTSPPYWGLRDYGTAKWSGGNPECDHKPEVQPRKERPRSGLTGGLDYCESKNPVYKDSCAKCGATREDAQIGLEKTPEEYVNKMVNVFRDVKRVLRNNGTLWLNIGDSYFGGGRGGNPDESSFRKQATNKGSLVAPTKVPSGCKPKDLVGIPWMLAFALRADGWYLRSDIIWHKPNVMPSSVTDRHTTAHEYLFLLTKSRKYYYDADAIKERAVCSGKVVSLGEKSFSKGQAKAKGIEPSGNGKADSYEVKKYRNKRTVWTITTQPYRGAHFATFPEKLVEPCILAGSKVGDTVLDPFCGSGTVGVVSLRYGRDFIGVELNPVYIDLAKKRISQETPLLSY